MRKLSFLLILCFSISSYAQRDEKAAYIRKNYIKSEHYIPMRDGVKLFTTIYEPKDKSKKHPVIITRTPYSLSPYGEERYHRSLIPSMLFVKEGYIIVYQDVRGRWMSEGEFMDIRPHNPDKKGKSDIDESSDTYDTVEWLMKNLTSHNGNVGIYGISYPGFYASASLPGAHPAVKAVSPQAPVTDWFIGDDFHHNGAFMLIDAFHFYSSFGVPRPKPITPDKGPKPFEYYTQDNYKFFLELGPLKNVQLKYFGDSIKFWNDLMKHGSYDDFWKARNIRTHLKDIKPVTMVVGGFFDAEDTWGALHTYKAIENQNTGNKNYLVMGPWYHGGWSGGTGGWYGEAKEILCDIDPVTNTATWYQENVEFPFFEKYLNNKTHPELSEAIIFETGSDTWRKFDSWPPEKSIEKTLYFHSNGILSFSAPGEQDSFDEFISDPAKPVPYYDGIHLIRTREYMTGDQRFASRRPDVMVYQTEPLEKDIVLAGPIIADLMVSTSGTDADWIVKLIDVYPDDYKKISPDNQTCGMDGYQLLVRGEVMRGKFRNSFEKPEPFVPGTPTQVKYALPDVAHCFRKGHRIMIQVQSSWFPLVDRNPQIFVDIYQADEKDFQKATHRIYHEKANASGVILNILEQSGSGYADLQFNNSDTVNLALIRKQVMAYIEMLKVPGKPTGWYYDSPGGDKKPSLYASCDVAIIRTVMGENLLKTLTPEERQAWIDHINSFAHPDGTYGPGRKLHSSHHANGMVIGALGVLGGRQKFPVRLYEDFDSPEEISQWLEKIDWQNQWNGSHLFWGGMHCFSMSNRCTGEWRAKAFDWLDENLDKKTGWWRNGVPHSGALQPLGGGAHIWPIYQHSDRRFPLPERVIDNILSLQMQDGKWLEYGNYMELDALYGLSYMSSLAPGYRRTDILNAAIRHGKGLISQWPEFMSQKPDLHVFLGAVSTFGLLQQLLPGTYRDTVKWTDIFSDIHLYQTQKVEIVK